MAADAADTLVTVEAGLDALETSVARETASSAAVIRAACPPVLALTLILALWQALYAAKIWPDWKLPGPAQVYSSLKDAFKASDVWRCRLGRYGRHHSCET